MTRPPLRRQRALGLALVSALVFLVLAGSRYARTTELIDDSLPLRAFGSRTVHRLLSSIGALHLTQSPDETWELPQVRRRGLRPGEPASVCPEQRYAAGRLSPDRLPSVSMADMDSVARGLPLVSVVVDSCHLRRLFEQPQERGRAWEVPAYLTYFDEGEARFSSGVGVRLHGNNSRDRARKSLRIYFRDSYGERRFLPGVVSDPSHPGPRQVVAVQDRQSDREKKIWHFITPLTYDISERLGGIVPEFKPVALTLNGVPQGIYVLTERINPGFLERRWGHTDFIVIPGKPPWDDGLGEHWERLRSWSKQHPAPLTAEAAAEHIDVNNFTRWLLTVVYAGTGDAFQSHMAKDRTIPDAKWFWISWDFDFSFRVPNRRPQFGWQKDLLWFITKGPGGWGSGPRNIAYRLLTEDETFRRHFSESMVRALNHEIDPKFMMARVQHYQEEATRLGLEPEYQAYFNDLREFVQRRPGAIRSQLQQHLGGGDDVWLRVSSPNDEAILVDGFGVDRRWQGAYLAGMTPQLTIAEARRSSFSHWEIDGQRSDTRAVSVPLTQDTQVVAVFR